MSENPHNPRRRSLLGLQVAPSGEGQRPGHFWGRPGMQCLHCGPGAEAHHGKSTQFQIRKVGKQTPEGRGLHRTTACAKMRMSSHLEVKCRQNGPFYTTPHALAAWEKVGLVPGFLLLRFRCPRMGMKGQVIAGLHNWP